MRFITYNIWFNEKNLSSRIKTLSREVKNQDADFIAFQEVTEDSLKIIEKSFSNYYFIGKDLNFVYDTLLISKHQPLNWEKYLLNTKMGRSILYGEFKINQQVLTVGTFHLESVFPQTTIKESQFNFITSLFKKPTVIMGDTNLSTPIDTHYLDAFLEASSPKIYENTYSKSNTHVSRYESRLDRIFYNFEAKIKRFELIGTEPTVILEKKSVHPSDHYGVLVDLDI